MHQTFWLPTHTCLRQAIYDVIEERFEGEPGIVYCFSKKEAENAAQVFCWILNAKYVYMYIYNIVYIYIYI